LDSTVVTIGQLRSTNAGLGSPLLSLGMVEHFWWRRLPHRDAIARLHHVPSEVRGCRRVVADVKPPLRRTPPIGTMAGHFWWSRLPHSETISRLLHVLSEARGCRRVVADVKRPQGRTIRIATGVADILRNRPGPSIPSPMPSPPSPYSPPHAAESPPQAGAASKDRAHRSAHKSPVTRERDRLLAHASLTSHPLPIADTPIPRRWRTIFPQNNHTGTDSIRNNQSPHETFRQPLCQEVRQRYIEPPML